MKKFFAFAFAALVLSSCDKEEATADSSFAMKASAADYSTACQLPVTTVTGAITTNTTWDNDHVWEIDGVVRVSNNATLTIEPGTFIKAKPRANNQATGVLVITKTGKINALGTAEAPIVFTSYRLLDCLANTTAVSGDMGGVVLLGDAVVNNGSVTNVIEGLGDQTPIADFQYGGTNNAHNAGIMQYVRIEFAGRILPTEGENGVEINGLTFGGVGNGTTIDHIQVTYGKDDGFEWFGGTVNASYLVAFGNDDDSFDFDLGYTGRITYALSLADFNSTHSLSGTSPDSNGIELDNDAAGSTNAPFTRPIVDKLSVVGLSCTNAGVLENGIHIRRNGRITLRNSTVSGYNRAMYIETPSDQINCSFNTVSVFACVSPFTNPSSITNVTNATGANFGMVQPFFNAGALNFSGATNGAFVDGVWTGSWNKFGNF